MIERKLLLILILICMHMYFVQGLSYSVELNYDDGNISLENIFLLDARAPERVYGGEYEAVVVSFNNSILFETGFNFELEYANAPDGAWFDEEGNQIIVPEHTSLIDKQAAKVIFLPYFKTGEHIVIEQYGELKLKINISEFAVCNQNGVCDEGETHEQCPEDCLCGNGICDEGETYENCSQDCEYVLKSNLNFWQRIMAFFKSLFN